MRTLGSLVYRYDKTFRDLMSTFPNRNWGIIFGQAWFKILRKKTNAHHFNGTNGSGKKGRGEICWKFNKGKCPHQNCHFEHKCSFCA